MRPPRPPPLPPILFLLLLLLLPPILSQPVLLGTLSSFTHDVNGNVFALNSRQLRITDFVYDGQGPLTFLWTGAGPVSSSGQPVPFSDCTIPDNLRAFNGETVDLELPDGLQLADVDYLSVWCERFGEDFGNIVFDDAIVATVPELAAGECAREDGEEAAGEGAGTFPVREGWNCEPLSDEFQVRWQVEGEDVNVELVARLAEEQYMGFGVSGRDDATDMVNSDVAIAFRADESFSAVDYFMSTREPCNEGRGVCPDTMLSPTPGSDNIRDVSGEANEGLTAVRYTRSLAAADADFDRPISAAGPTFISWAIGPISPSTGLPVFHAGPMNFPRSDVSIEFGRSVADNCQALVGGEEAEPVPGFLRPTISNVTEVTARIGPSAGSRGVEGISGRPAWGIAWYMSRTGSSGEDVLIPAIAVERGKTYRFSVQGGVDDGSDTVFHPLYITDSAVGGYLTRTPAERAQEKVFAGVEVTETDDDGGVVAFRSTATGALCNIGSSLAGDTAEVQTWEEYADTLDLSCADDPAIQEGAGTLEWTVPVDAPEVVYYQCVTHQVLGWKLVVFDEGEVDENRLRRENGGGALDDGECRVTFKGEERTFGGCQLGLSGGVEVYWTVREADGEIDTLFRAQTDGGYVGWGWGYSRMVGSNAVIAFEGPDGPEIRDYFLEAQSTQGVQPNVNQQLSNMEVEVNGGFVAGVFTRSLEVSGVPTIPADGTIDAIWALGDMPGSASTLQQHDRTLRGIVQLDLSGSGVVEQGTGLNAYDTAHAVLMIIGWLGLTPAAVLLMRYLKGWNPKTFQLHRALNVLSVIVVVIAYAMGLARGSRTEAAHLVLGTVAIVLALSQVVSGTLRPAKTSRLRRRFNFGHGLVGYTALHVGMANALVGMILFNVEVGWFVAWGILVGAYVLGHVGLTVFRNRIPYEDATPEKALGEAPPP